MPPRVYPQLSVSVWGRSRRECDTGKGKVTFHWLLNHSSVGGRQGRDRETLRDLPSEPDGKYPSSALGSEPNNLSAFQPAVVLVQDVPMFVSQQKNSWDETLLATFKCTPWTHTAVISKPDPPSLQRSSSSLTLPVSFLPPLSCLSISLPIVAIQIELGWCCGDLQIF